MIFFIGVYVFLDRGVYFGFDMVRKCDLGCDMIMIFWFFDREFFVIVCVVVLERVVR